MIKGSCLAQALGEAKFTNMKEMFLVTLLCYLCPTWVFNKPTSEAAEAGLLNESSCLTAALGMTKFKAVIAMYLVTLWCAT